MYIYAISSSQYLHYNNKKKNHLSNNLKQCQSSHTCVKRSKNPLSVGVFIITSTQFIMFFYIKNDPIDRVMLRFMWTFLVVQSILPCCIPFNHGISLMISHQIQVDNNVLKLFYLLDVTDDFFFFLFLVSRRLEA